MSTAIPVTSISDVYANNPLYKEESRTTQTYQDKRIVKIDYRTKEDLGLRIARLVGLTFLTICTLGMILISKTLRSECDRTIHSFSKRTVYLKDPQLMDNLPLEALEFHLAPFLSPQELQALALMNRHLSQLTETLSKVGSSEQVGQDLKSLHSLRQVVRMAPNYRFSADGMTKIPYTEDELKERHEKLLESLMLIAPKHIFQVYTFSLSFKTERGIHEDSLRAPFYTFLSHYTRDSKDSIFDAIKNIVRQKCPDQDERIYYIHESGFFDGPMSQLTQHINGAHESLPLHLGVEVQGSTLKVTPFIDPND